MSEVAFVPQECLDCGTQPSADRWCGACRRQLVQVVPNGREIFFDFSLMSYVVSIPKVFRSTYYSRREYHQEGELPLLEKLTPRLCVHTGTFAEVLKHAVEDRDGEIVNVPFFRAEIDEDF